MKFYQSKFKRLPGTSYKEIYDQAWVHYQSIKKRTKRQPYVRSKYFEGQKVFLNLFWAHLRGKNNLRDKARRLKYFLAGIDLLRHNIFDSTSKENPNKKHEIYHRFYGVTQCGSNFALQIKEDKRSGRKFFISVFPFE